VARAATGAATACARHAHEWAGRAARAERAASASKRKAAGWRGHGVEVEVEVVRYRRMVDHVFAIRGR
jgi:hypothetical protein